MAGPCPPDNDNLAYGIQGPDLIEISLSKDNQRALIGQPITPGGGKACGNTLFASRRGFGAQIDAIMSKPISIIIIIVVNKSVGCKP
jgi:hypothetical protein